MRLDVYLTAHSYAPSRTRAQELISGGYVTVNGKNIRKPSYDMDISCEYTIDITGRPHPYVGRGGLKLEAALQTFSVSVTGAVCADIGASTGGFTDCLLRHGASRVFAVDAGVDQLDASLRADARVVNLERTNARNLTPEMFGCLCDVAVADVSFISQTYILPNIHSVLRTGGIYIGLIKPQFECGRQALDRHGIVKDAEMHLAAIRRVLSSASAVGLRCQSVMASPITGGDGNREFLYCCVRGDTAEPLSFSDAELRKMSKV